MRRKLMWITGLVILVILMTVMTFIFSRRSVVHNIEKPLYLAMGDSIASGQGLKTDSDSSACYRTEESYPHYVASVLKYKLISGACSGASINDGILGSQNVNGADFESQINLLTKNKPQLITITIGANDVDWTKFIAKCFISDCGTTDDSAQTLPKLDALAINLTKLLQIIKDKTDGSIPTIVTGYYQMFPSSISKCNLPSGITNEEVIWLHQQTDLLNQTIQKSTDGFNFSHYAQVSFSGHELCTQKSWIQDLQSKAPFHPTAEGQTAIGQAIIASIPK